MTKEVDKPYKVWSFIDVDYCYDLGYTTFDFPHLECTYLTEEEFSLFKEGMTTSDHKQYKYLVFDVRNPCNHKNILDMVEVGKKSLKLKEQKALEHKNKTAKDQLKAAEKRFKKQQEKLEALRKEVKE